MISNSACTFGAIQMPTFKIKFNTVSLLEYVLENSGKM